MAQNIPRDKTFIETELSLKTVVIVGSKGAFGQKVTSDVQFLLCRFCFSSSLDHPIAPKLVMYLNIMALLRKKFVSRSA